MRVNKDKEILMLHFSQEICNASVFWYHDWLCNSFIFIYLFAPVYMLQ